MEAASQPGTSAREDRLRPGTLVRIIGNKRFNAQKHKLAVVVSTPKMKQRKASSSRQGQDAHSGLPIGGWHYIICLQDSKSQPPRPCSIQGNAIRPEPGNQQDRCNAQLALERYKQAEETVELSGNDEPSTNPARRQHPHSSDSFETQVHKGYDGQTLSPVLVELCERFQKCRSISKDSIQTVTAGLTLFGMRGSHVDIPSMLASWEKMRRGQEQLRQHCDRLILQDPISSMPTLQSRACQPQLTPRKFSHWESVPAFTR